MEGAERKLPPPMRPPLAAKLGWGRASSRPSAAVSNAGNIRPLSSRRSTEEEGWEGNAGLRKAKGWSEI